MSKGKKIYAELEYKAKEYAKHFDYCNLYECALDRCERAYKDGYEQGQNFQRGVFAENCGRCSRKKRKLSKENEELKALADNRGAFIDWILEHYPDIVKEYTGFKE